MRKVKKVRFQIDRHAWKNFVSLPRMKYTSLVQMADKSWQRMDLVLYDLNEFTDYSEQRKSSLDKSVLARLMRRFKEDYKYRRDCLVLKVCGPTANECHTSPLDFAWQSDEETRQKVLSVGLWERSFVDSKFRCDEYHYWVSEPFLMSALEFPLMDQRVYAKISFYLSQAACRNDRESPLDEDWWYTNLLDGRGLVRVRRQQMIAPLDATGVSCNMGAKHCLPAKLTVAKTRYEDVQRKVLLEREMHRYSDARLRGGNFWRRYHTKLPLLVPVTLPTRTEPTTLPTRTEPTTLPTGTHRKRKIFDGVDVDDCHSDDDIQKKKKTCRF